VCSQNAKNFPLNEVVCFVACKLSRGVSIKLIKFIGAVIGEAVIAIFPYNLEGSDPIMMVIRSEVFQLGVVYGWVGWVGFN
jgi:hypothetical protein